VVPSTWLSVVLFLLFIAPGLLFDLLSTRRRVGQPESTFREISRVVLASLGFTAVGLLVVVVVRVVRPAWMPDPRLLLAHGHSYLIDHYAAVAGALAIQTFVALAAAGALHLVLAHKRKGPPLRSVSSWKTVLRDECPPAHAPYVRIRQADGGVLIGMVGQYSVDLDQADREIVLAPPLFVQPAEGELRAVPGEWQRIVVPGSNVASLAVQYRPAPKAKQKAKP
jgi:hypothetical protein